VFSCAEKIDWLHRGDQLTGRVIICIVETNT
jgi:hypothetical protein